MFVDILKKRKKRKTKSMINVFFKKPPSFELTHSTRRQPLLVVFRRFASMFFIVAATAEEVSGTGEHTLIQRITLFLLCVVE
jgi:hypothetical protein